MNQKSNTEPSCFDDTCYKKVRYTLVYQNKESPLMDSHFNFPVPVYV